MKKVLVTGGAGFIGSHVVDAYLKLGHQVAVLDDLSTGRKENINPKAKFYMADMRDYKKVAQIFAKEKPNIINHHAAQIDVRRSTREPIFDVECNILASINLLMEAKKHKVKKFIYANTGGALYGEIKPQDIPVDENYPIRPVCEYGISKHTVEHYLFLHSHNYGLNYVSLRYPNVYGPRQDPKGEAGVIAIFVGKMLKGVRPTIFGDGTQTRDYTFIEDIVSANISALTKGKNEAFNLGTGVETSVLEVFKELEKNLPPHQLPVGVGVYPSHLNKCQGEKTGLKPKFAPKRVGEIKCFALNANKAKRLLGWRPKYSFAEGIKKTIAFYKKKVG